MWESPDTMDSLVCSSYRTLATLTKWLGAILGANVARYQPTPGDAQPLLSQVNGIQGDIRHCLATPGI